MSATPREIGTLVIVILKAQHLPNKRHIGKQDPYCCVTLNGEKRRTRAIKRGGQHPEWDEEVRFTLYEDTEDTLARIANGGDTPPPPPPKEVKRKKKVKGGNAMIVACYADDPKEPELIGETLVDLTEVLTKGETDEWFTLQNKDKFSGEVYLELTFWSNEKPPEKKRQTRQSMSNKHYGGPGSFVPSESDNGFSDADRNSLPHSLRTSSSLAKLNLYNPPYDSQSARTIRTQGTGSTLNQLADEFGGLSVGPDPSVLQRRRESFPPRNGHTPLPSDSTYSTMHASISYHSTGFGSADYSDPGASYSYESPTTPVPQNHHPRHSFAEPSQTYTPYKSPYDPNTAHSGGYSPSHAHSQADYGSTMYNVPSASSGFVPVSNSAPSGFAPVSTGTPAPSGFMPPISRTPAPSGYSQHPSQTPVPYGYKPPSQPTAPSGFAPPSSSMGYHQTPVQTYSPYQQYPLQPASAPPMMYAPGPPSAVQPSSHSAPPQQYMSMPSPSQIVSSQQYPAYAPNTPSPPQLPPQQYNPSPPVQGSRPLPTPGMQNGAYPATPPHAVKPTPPPAVSPTHSGSVVYANTAPHMQTQPQSYPLPTPPGPPPQLPTNTGTNSFIPPPPPLPLRRLSGPPPTAPSSQYYQQQGSSEAPNGYGQSSARPALPQPPTNAGNVLPLPPPLSLQPGSGFQPPPPPPPLARRTVSQSQHPLPQPPAVPLWSVKPGEIYNPGPPPRPPAQVVYDIKGDTGMLRRNE